MNATSAVNAYSKIGVESSITSADPHKLISMLYQGALLAINAAKEQMLRRDIAAKCVSLKKAMAIVDEGLKASLDMNAGGEIAQNLAALYDYMCYRLLVANLKNDTNILDEVSRLLNELYGAWEAIRPEVISSGTPQPQMQSAKPEKLTYGKM